MRARAGASRSPSPAAALDGTALHLERLDALPTLVAFEAMLAEPGPWLAAFDFPFGLPREFIAALALGDTSDAVIAELHRRCPQRMALRALIDGWGNARAPGSRLLHRRTDRAVPGIVSSSPLQTRYVPVGFMYYEGMARLVRAGITIPRQRAGDPARIAVEGYPGLLAFELVGRRSYKNLDAPDRRARARRHRRARSPPAARASACGSRSPARQRAALVDDPSGDCLDAVLCLAQAGWASLRPHGGRPESVDPVEGWIATAE